MKKKFKCKDCGWEVEGETAPASCGCKGEKGFNDVSTKEVDVTVKGAAYTEMMKSLNDITSELKEQRQKNVEGQKVDTERMEKIEEDLKKVVDTQRDHQSKVKRTGEFDVSTKDIQNAIEGKHGSLNVDELLYMDTKDEALSEFQRKNDDIFILASILHTDPRELKTYQDFKKTAFFKAMTGDTAGQGAEWVPTGASAQLIDLVRVNLQVAALHPSITMPQQMGPFELPGVTGDLKAYRSTGESAGSDSPSKFRSSIRGTRKVTFTAELLTVRTVFEGALVEDSIVPILPILRGNIARAIADAIENTIINGDTTGTIDHLDMHGDTFTSQSPEKSWDGYREHAKDINAGSQDGVTDVGGAFASTGATLRASRAKMGKYGLTPNKIAYVTGIKGFINQMMGLRDVQTLDKFGPKAVVLNGELGKHDGIPIVVSAWQRENLNGTGVSAGASATGFVDTAMQIVYKDAFMMGDKRRITIETSKIQGTDSWELWATWRGDLQPLYATSEPVIHNLVDIS